MDEKAIYTHNISTTSCGNPRSFNASRHIRPIEKTPDEVNEFIKLLLQKIFVTEGKLETDVLKNDPDDNMVLAAALEGQATCFVTGNTKHFPFAEYQGVKIVKPQEFVEILNSLED